MAAKSTKEDKTWDRMNVLHREKGVSHDDPGFTIQEYAQKYGMSYSGAVSRLKQFVRTKQLVAGWRVVNSRNVSVYRFPESV